MGGKAKWIVPLLISLPLFWLNYQQLAKVDELRSVEAKLQQKFDSVSKKLSQLEQWKQGMDANLQRKRLLLQDLTQLVFETDKEGLEIPSDCFSEDNLIVVRSGLANNLDIRFLLPANNKVQLLVRKIEGESGAPKPLSDDSFISIKFDDPGWHSITAKMEKGETGSRLPLLADGEEKYSIDLGSREWQGGTSYSPGSLPRVFSLDQSEEATHSINSNWRLNFYEENKSTGFGYHVHSMRVSEK